MAKAGLLVGSYATIKENEGTNWKVIDSSKVFVGDDIYSVDDLVKVRETGTFERGATAGSGVQGFSDLVP